MEFELGRGKRARRAYGFDEVALVPGRVTVNPAEIDVSFSVNGTTLDIPFLAAAALVTFSALSVPSFAQEAQQKDQDRDRMKPVEATITGCLTKSDQGDGWILADSQSGAKTVARAWPLRTRSMGARTASCSTYPATRVWTTVLRRSKPRGGICWRLRSGSSIRNYSRKGGPPIWFRTLF